MKELKGYFLIIVAAVFWGILATIAKFLLNQNLASAALFLDEYLNPPQVVGAVLVLAAIAVLQLKREQPGTISLVEGADAA